MHSLSIATWTFILSHFSLSFTWFIIIFLVGVGCVFSTYYLNFEFYFEVRSNWCNGVFIMVKVNHDIANDLGVDVELEELYQLSMWVSDIMVEKLRFFQIKGACWWNLGACLSWWTKWYSLYAREKVVHPMVHEK